MVSLVFANLPNKIYVSIEKVQVIRCKGFVTYEKFGYFDSTLHHQIRDDIMSIKCEHTGETFYY